MSYKEFNTPNALRGVTDSKLIAFNITDKEMRKQVLVALTKAGYGPRISPSNSEPAATQTRSTGAIVRDLRWS